MITSNVIQRTFQIQYNNGSGTCFSIDIDNKQYFVTARHVIEGLKTGDNIELSYQKKWYKISVTLIGHSSDTDVSVFAISDFIHNAPLPANSNGIIYGQDVYFLGFPYGLKSDVGSLNRDFPIPMVKKAIVSNFVFENKLKVILLDGLNNPGFSGGPVVYKEPNQIDFKVAGVISGYRYELEDALINNQPANIQVRINTGIIISYAIEAALDLIEQNPNGKDFRNQ